MSTAFLDRLAPLPGASRHEQRLTNALGLRTHPTRWLDGVSHALRILPPRLRVWRPCATAARRPRLRLPGTTGIRVRSPWPIAQERQGEQRSDCQLPHAGYDTHSFEDHSSAHDHRTTSTHRIDRTTTPRRTRGTATLSIPAVGADRRHPVEKSYLELRAGHPPHGDLGSPGACKSARDRVACASSVPRRRGVVRTSERCGRLESAMSRRRSTAGE